MGSKLKGPACFRAILNWLNRTPDLGGGCGGFPTPSPSTYHATARGHIPDCHDRRRLLPPSHDTLRKRHHRAGPGYARRDLLRLSAADCFVSNVGASKSSDLSTTSTSLRDVLYTVRGCDRLLGQKRRGVSTWGALEGHLPATAHIRPRPIKQRAQRIPH